MPVAVCVVYVRLDCPLSGCALLSYVAFVCASMCFDFVITNVVCVCMCVYAVLFVLFCRLLYDCVCVSRLSYCIRMPVVVGFGMCVNVFLLGLHAGCRLCCCVAMFPDLGIMPVVVWLCVYV